MDDTTPLSGDCGSLCGAVCCKSEGEDMVIYLLPGEEKLFTKKEDWLEWSYDYARDYDFPPSWKGRVYYVTCKTAPCCPRHLRPLQCRFFPLTPHLDPQGKLLLIRYPEALPYRCPLLDEDVSLRPDFIQAVRTAWEILLKDPLIYDLVAYDSQSRDPSQLKIVSLPKP